MIFKSLFIVLGFGMLLGGCKVTKQQICSAVIAATPENTAMAVALGVPVLDANAVNMIISGDCAAVQSFPTVPATTP